MGNTSGSEFGGILIRTEKQVYFAGDIIKGCIYLHITKEGFQGREVKFYVVGKEKTEWATGGGQRRTIHQGFNKFHVQAVVAHRFADEHLKVGSFTFPFELHLPSQLPGSYFLDGNVKASLKYKVKARVISMNKSINHIFNKQEITLREPIKENMHPITVNETAELLICCCQKRGQSTFTGTIKKNLYFQDQQVDIQYDANNSQCKLDVTKIEISIMNILTLRSDAGSIKAFNFPLRQVTLGGIQSGNKIQPSDQKTCSLTISHDDRPDKIVTPSCNGDMVNSAYYVIIKPIFEGCNCCCLKPVVYLPFTVLSQLPEEYTQHIDEPQNWKPQEFQPLIIKPNTNDPLNQKNNNFNQMNQMKL